MSETTIYRCGWCGLPVQQTGELLPEMNTGELIEAYLDQHKELMVEKVNGECCRIEQSRIADMENPNE